MKKALLLIVIVTACTPVYIPNIRNSPMFTKGGEFQAAVQIGNGIEGQTALALTNHIGIMANYSYINNDRINTKDYLRHTLFEGGFGYFQNEETMFFEVFAGYGKGLGSSSNSFLGVPGATGRYERYFIQPAFGLNKKIMHVSFVPRISVLNFTEFSNGSTRYPINENSKVFFEPAVIGRVNTANNHIFFTFQGGLSTAISNNVYFDHRSLQFSMGLGIRLGGVSYLPEKKVQR